MLTRSQQRRIEHKERLDRLHHLLPEVFACLPGGVVRTTIACLGNEWRQWSTCQYHSHPHQLAAEQPDKPFIPLWVAQAQWASWNKQQRGAAIAGAASHDQVASLSWMQQQEGWEADNICKVAATGVCARRFALPWPCMAA